MKAQVARYGCFCCFLYTLQGSFLCFKGSQRQLSLARVRAGSSLLFCTQRHTQWCTWLMCYMTEVHISFSLVPYRYHHSTGSGFEPDTFIGRNEALPVLTDITVSIVHLHPLYHTHTHPNHWHLQSRVAKWKYQNCSFDLYFCAISNLQERYLQEDSLWQTLLISP